VAEEPDPGWQLSWRSFVFFLPVGSRRPGAHTTEPLLTLRSVFVNFCVALVVFGIAIALLVLFVDEPATRSLVWLSVVVVGGAASLGVTNMFEGPLDCRSTDALRASYQRRFFTRMAVGESPALLGLVAAFAGGPWWSYYVGMVFALVNYAYAAPSARNLAADQARLTQRGGPLSLVEALRTTPTPPS
jgi:F0F1-type ATP synthase membrane subunit c/vacuolar-type H+-ATPase subunit K